jgi:methylmalonyl-CoA mutase N-terminal domain/subunit
VNTADPAGGSERIEELTDAIERGVDEYLARIDAMGGTLRAIEEGYIQSEIQNAAYEYQRAVESGERILVGVNRFQQADERAVPVFRIDPALERAQVEKLRQVRASRSQSAVTERLAALETAARTGANLMPAILDAADAYATVGEASGKLRLVFGEYREP